MNRTTLITLTFLVIALAGISQHKALTFKQAEEQGIRITTLDTLYPSALHVVAPKAVFNGKEDAFIKAYQQTLMDLGKFLAQHQFGWEKQTKCFNRIYFNQNGSIDYFLYNFKPGEVTAEKEARFDTLLNQFIQTYKFPLTATTNFAQCSPVTYNDAEKEKK